MLVVFPKSYELQILVISMWEACGWGSKHGCRFCKVVNLETFANPIAGMLMPPLGAGFPLHPPPTGASPSLVNVATAAPTVDMAPTNKTSFEPFDKNKSSTTSTQSRKTNKLPFPSTSFRSCAACRCIHLEIQSQHKVKSKEGANNEMIVRRSNRFSS
jgi:hypothetical protein